VVFQTFAGLNKQPSKQQNIHLAKPVSELIIEAEHYHANHKTLPADFHSIPEVGELFTHVFQVSSN